MLNQLVDNFLPAPGQTYNGGITSHGPAIFGDPNYTGMRRPFIDRNGNCAVTINTGRWTKQDSTGGERRPIKEHVLVRDLINRGMFPSPVVNATFLRKEEWLELDRVVLRPARYRLRAYADLAAANTFGGFNGMGKMVLEHETMTDPGMAVVDMNGLTAGKNDAPKFQLEGLPLPITHCDFNFDSRTLNISRNTGTPLDTTMGEAAGRRVAESIESQTLGTQTGAIYGGNSTMTGGYGRTSQVYGYTNFPTRLTKTNLTAPTGSNASSTLADVLAMKDQLALRKFYGPFMLYHSNDWDQYMDNDYILSGGNVATQTLRNRLRSIDGITDVRRLDFLFATQPQTNPYWTSSTVSTTGNAIYTGPGGETIDATLKVFTLIMIQLTPDVARAVNGMSITTMQWETIGGLQLNFKVMAIQVPQIRADFYGNCGLLHATTT